jgi:putative transposase
MSRPLRIEFPGARYHVTARGNEQKAIVRDDVDREDWVVTFGLVCARFGWRCLEWCLMDNHFHFVLETPKANLARGMQGLNGRYATLQSAAWPRRPSLPRPVQGAARAE